jgi:HlyD family secretion protein
MEVAVSEADVGFIQTGQAVTFLLHAFPEKKFDGKVERVREKAEIVNQQNSFIVEVDVSEDLAAFKSGMKGEAKVRCEKESLGYILIRNIINFFRIRLFF